ncbi:MAG: DUF484 family protein [Bordetella sp.]|jgi:uncharacterized protein YigA (DUF484 family)
MTDDQVKAFLLERPGFLNEHPELLFKLEIEADPVEQSQGGSVVSLVERQAALLRAKVRHQEARVAQLLRVVEENNAIHQKLLAWIRSLLLAKTQSQRAKQSVVGLAQTFSVPFVRLVAWEPEAELQKIFRGLQPECQALAQLGIDEKTQTLIAEMATALAHPICLPASSHQAGLAFVGVGAKEGPQDLGINPSGSVALLPLRVGLAPKASGLLVLASDDAGRFSQDHGIDFLVSIAELVSASLLGGTLTRPVKLKKVKDNAVG